MKRGPYKKGAAAAKQKGAETPLSAIEPAVITEPTAVAGMQAEPAVVALPVVDSSAPPVKGAPRKRVIVELSAADRENPEKLTGPALHELAHRMGMSRSEIERLASDEAKIRMELRYLTNRCYSDELEAA